MCLCQNSFFSVCCLIHEDRSVIQVTRTDQRPGECMFEEFLFCFWYWKVDQRLVKEPLSQVSFVIPIKTIGSEVLNLVHFNKISNVGSVFVIL